MERITLLSKHALLWILICISPSVIAQDFNVQHIQDDIDETGGTNTSFTAVSSTTSAFALPTNNRKTHAGRSNSNNGDLEGYDMAGARVLTGINTLTYYREGSSLNSDMRFNTSIWEYTGAPGGANEFIVRGRYAVDLNGTTSGVATDITASGVVDANKCIPFITGIMNDNSADGSDSGSAIAWLSSTTNLEIRKGSTSNNVRVYITIVEFTGSNWTVHHTTAGGNISNTGSLTLKDGADGTGSTTSVSSWSNAIIFTQSKAQTATSGSPKEYVDSQWPIIAPGADTQTVDWTYDSGRSTAANNKSKHFVHVLENSEITVTRFTDTSSADNESNVDITSAGLTSLDQSMIIGTSISSGSDNEYGKGWRNYYLNSITQAAHWCHRSSSTMSHNIQIIDFFTTPTQTEGPGGVTSNLELWLKADSGVEELASDSAEHADPVLNWLDNTINNNDATQITGTNKPTYTDGVLNFNPVIDFDGDDLLQTSAISTNSDMTVFTVAEGQSGVQKQILNLNGGDNIIIEYEDATPTFRGRMYDGTNTGEISTTTVADGITYITNYDVYSGSNSELFINGSSIGTDATNTYAPTSPIANIGGHPSNTAKRWDGGMAEVIIYDGSITNAERDKIESYLAIKYGVTLGTNGTSQDYVDSDGRVIWDQSDNAGFNYNVTGIGQDDVTELNQKQSKSINTTDDITIGIKDIATNNSTNTNSFFADKTFLMWGHDNGATTATTDITKDFGAGTAVTSSVSVTPIIRKWKMVVTDSVPTIKLSIPESMVSATNVSGEEYVMIVADDASFTTNVTSATMEDVGTELEVDFYFEGTKYVTFGSTPEIAIGSRSAHFDNYLTTDSYLDAGDVNDLDNTDYTISAWVKRDVGENKFDIVSKRNYFHEGAGSPPETYTHGYAFRINTSSQFRMVWRDPNDSSNNVMQTSATIPENEWHHIAATYDSGTNMTSLYIDGYLEDSDDTLDPMETPSDAHFLIGAAHHIKRQQKMRGSVDEVRVWNVALSADQIRYIMNQEIENNSSFADGVVLPTSTTKNEIEPIPWNNLIAYYPMSTLVFGSIKDESNSGNDASMINYNDLDNQTAPLPYKTTGDGAWDSSTTWENGDVQYLPGVDSYLDALETIDYNIVQIDHNITMDNSNTALIPASRNGNRTVLGLIVNSGGDLQIDGDTASNTGFGLTVSHYLKLDGTIDLEGESQLIQTTDSDFDATSTGTLERDQQGNANTYLYNYWSSPVAPTSNASYTLPNIFNGLDFLTSGYDGTASPVAVADYWIWKYSNRPTDDYSQWQHVRSTGSLLPGEGFTMKGPGTLTINQNYELLGQPNNGDITLTLNDDNDYLIGNPYPSAIDANAFILDHISVNNGGNYSSTTENIINGALYFWDHFANNTHYLSGYEGGYATYTLMGGAVAISNDTRINTSNAVGTKLPERYIPVGQGFFVSAVLDSDLIGDPNDPGIALPVNGGTITFRNSHRVFQKEIVSGSNTGSLFLKSNTKGKSATTHKKVDTRQKIKLMFDSPGGYHRQLLVGTDENASKGFDVGYDAPLIEDNEEDIFWTHLGCGFVIQAVNNFDNDQTLPLGLKINEDGLATIKIDTLENIASNKEIYLHDKELNIYHDLKANNYEVYLNTDTNTDRFEITFQSSQSLLEVDDVEETNLQVYFSNEKQSIIIHNPGFKTLKSIHVYNILGQSVFNFNENTSKNYLEYNTEHIKPGAYIVKTTTENGILSKKVIIK
ncbi:LamG-like jellyroll fold domain-containing protein [Flavivirga aquimarina]|uniref:LamG-like jellyroll fold domain-containing protein n=1 Tax=Flavivirga aquimarina TaxID=2027862 RepID=A0ABT8WEX0_9FLAO|nr:LamG-like jellyroll fold domain-containing protein [Flavivirga aquimarina]MDO5971717.1 LamG-like jellyroll fold domain-containing protein [Flavivirga aquimarina]